MLRARFALSLVLAPIFAATACGNGNDAAPADTGSDVVVDAVRDTGPADTSIDPPPDTGPQRHCTLDNGADPVGLCVQKVVFQQWHEAGFAADLGIAQSWDSTTFLPDKDGSGAILHDVRDDVLYAASIARYRQSARRYGDTELEALLRSDFGKVLVKIEAELTAPAASLDGELYAALRMTAVGCKLVDLTEDAKKIDALADALGASFYDAYYHELGPIPPPGGDAGDSGDASLDAAADSGARDSTVDGVADAPPDVPVVDGILGTAAGGAFTYRPADAAAGAFALLDMAARHADDPHALDWQRAALATFDHLRRRATEPTTGMLYTSLTTSADPAHDAVDGADDTLLTEVQAGVALALSRAREVVSVGAPFAPTVHAYPFSPSAAAILDATQNAPLWDDANKGYLAGWSPTTRTTVARKTTRGNALMFAAIHRVYVQFGTAAASNLKPLRVVLLQRTPPNTSLLSAAATDQGSYFREVTPAFGLPDTPARAKSFFTTANAVACEGLDEQWFGLAL